MKKTRMDDKNALFRVVAAATGVVAVVAADESESQRRNLRNQCLCPSSQRSF